MELKGEELPDGINAEDFSDEQIARTARLAKRPGSPSVAAVTEKPGLGVLLLIGATQALYDAASAYGYQRRDVKVATSPF